MGSSRPFAQKRTYNSFEGKEPALPWRYFLFKSAKIKKKYFTKAKERDGPSCRRADTKCPHLIYWFYQKRPKRSSGWLNKNKTRSSDTIRGAFTWQNHNKITIGRRFFLRKQEAQKRVLPPISWTTQYSIFPLKSWWLERDRRGRPDVHKTKAGSLYHTLGTGDRRLFLMADMTSPGALHELQARLSL